MRAWTDGRNTVWVDIDRLLEAFGLSRLEMADAARVTEAVNRMAARMPVYITLKDVAQLDPWLRDGSAAYVDALCDWR